MNLRFTLYFACCVGLIAFWIYFTISWLYARAAILRCGRFKVTELYLELVRLMVFQDAKVAVV